MLDGQNKKGEGVIEVILLIRTYKNMTENNFRDINKMSVGYLLTIQK